MYIGHRKEFQSWNIDWPLAFFMEMKYLSQFF